jgi:hypothetical protein
MKKAHFQYVGYTRSGSTFLHRVFRQHPQLKDCASNVVKEFYSDNLNTYKNTYSKFDYSINMYASILIRRPVEYISMTNPLTDKFFACIRNPYDAFSSSFALWNGHGHLPAHAMRFAECAENLIFLKSNITKPFKIFYFEDLVTQEQDFIKDVCEFLEIDRPVIDTSGLLKHSSTEVYHNIDVCGNVSAINGPLTIREKTDTVPEYKFSNQEIEYFNLKITELEQYLDRDFSHWKR